MYVILLSHVLDTFFKYLTDNVGDDCPVFDGLFEYCSISAGGSMGKILRRDTYAKISDLIT